MSEIIAILNDPASLPDRAFEVLQGISQYVNNPETEETGRDMVLRALEKRSQFQGFSDVLEGLTREVGLFPYLDQDELSLRDALAYEFHKPREDADFVFHRVQAQVFRRLMDGDNVILSAPTSFGKSRIIDCIIDSDRYRNIAIIVPTIALIDETRRRLSAFSSRFKVISQLSQKPADNNLFVFTAERLNAYEELPPIDFFVIDEFYKLGLVGEDDSARVVALNQAFYRLNKNGGQFYLLGPSIRSIPEGVEDKLPCYFIPTKFATVVSDVIEVYKWSNDIGTLLEICSTIEEPTLIFCKSPARVNEVARALLNAGIGRKSPHMAGAAKWIGEQFHVDWVYSHALARGIGLHHGRLPRSLGQLSVHSFNQGSIRFLVCTSTLIEGVNTCAKNVIIFDHAINRRKFDFFTFNNIRGRSGRMFEHFVGRVYLFHPPPQEDLPYVDFPAITQDASTPDSLLIQIDEEDLILDAKERMKEVYQQDALPVDIVRKNSTLDPMAQIDLAKELWSLSRASATQFWWSSFPTYDQLRNAVRLVWKHFIKRARSGVFSADQLTLKIWSLCLTPSVKSRVIDELKPGKYQAASADEAVERVLSFDRNWAGFEFPRLLMALSRIQDHVFSKRFSASGNYSFFASRVEQLFRNPTLIALEEYGLPIQIGEKIAASFELSEEFDIALDQVRRFNASGMAFDDFERNVIKDVQRSI